MACRSFSAHRRQAWRCRPSCRRLLRAPLQLVVSLQFCEGLGQSFDQGVVIRDLLAHLRHQRGLLVALAAQLVDFVLELAELAATASDPSRAL